MATRAMDPTLARQALIVAALLCAVPSLAVAVFALRDAPASERTVRDRLERAASELDSEPPAETALGWQATTRTSVGSLDGEAEGRSRPFARSGTDVGTASAAEHTPDATEAATGEVAANPKSEIYAERKRRFEDESASGQNRPDLAAALDARLAKQPIPFIDGAAKREVRCTNSVCEVILGAKPPGALDAADSATEPGRVAAPSAFPWKRSSARVFIETSMLGSAAAPAPPPGAEDGNGVVPPPEVAAAPIQATPEPAATIEAATVDQPAGVDVAPAEPAPGEGPAGESATTE